jgi:hypothetical protein
MWEVSGRRDWQAALYHPAWRDPDVDNGACAHAAACAIFFAAHNIDLLCWI